MIIKKVFFENLIMKILSRVSHLCHFLVILTNHNEIPRILFFFCGKIFTSFYDNFAQKIPIQKCF